VNDDPATCRPTDHGAFDSLLALPSEKVSNFSEFSHGKNSILVVRGRTNATYEDCRVGITQVLR
jgi:hypothetical protein